MIIVMIIFTYPIQNKARTSCDIRLLLGLSSEKMQLGKRHCHFVGYRKDMSLDLAFAGAETLIYWPLHWAASPQPRMPPRQCDARRENNAVWVGMENRGLFRMKRHACAHAHTHTCTDHTCVAVSLGIQKRSSISLAVTVEVFHIFLKMPLGGWRCSTQCLGLSFYWHSFASWVFIDNLLPGSVLNG